MTRAPLASGATCAAYETVEHELDRLPPLAPMSDVAGTLAAQAGAFMLAAPLGVRGILLGGVPGVATAKVMIVGGDVGGTNAAAMALTCRARFRSPRLPR